MYETGDKPAALFVKQTLQHGCHRLQTTYRQTVGVANGGRIEQEQRRNGCNADRSGHVWYGAAALSITGVGQANASMFAEWANETYI